MREGRAGERRGAKGSEGEGESGPRVLEGAWPVKRKRKAGATRNSGPPLDLAPFTVHPASKGHSSRWVSRDVGV